MQERMKFLDSRICELEKRYKAIKIAPKIEYNIKEELVDRVTYKKILTPITPDQGSSSCKYFTLNLFRS